MKKTLTVTDWSKQQYDVVVEAGKSISIECTYTNARNPKRTFVSFEIGGEAVFGGYNLTYTGKIISITEKTVTIDTGMNERRRLTLADFCDKNWDYNKEKIAEHNRAESYCI